MRPKFRTATLTAASPKQSVTPLGVAAQAGEDLLVRADFTGTPVEDEAMRGGLSARVAHEQSVS